MTLNYLLAATGLLLLGLLGAATAPAQVERSGGGNADAQLVQEYQQAMAQQAQLQMQNTKLQSDLDEARKQLKAAQQQLGAARSGAAAGEATIQAQAQAAQVARDSATKSLADTRARMQELVDRFRDTIATLKGVETDRTQLRQQLAQSKASFDQCARSNDALYQVDEQVLDRYQHQSVLGYLERAEPFTRIKRTQIDNLVVEYRQRAEALRVPGQPSAAAAKTAGTQ